jgi:Protein of unknown function (DUF559)
VAESVRGPGSDKVRTLAAAAHGRAANPFESALRWMRCRCPAWWSSRRWSCRRPRWAHPDLVDVHLRVVLEAESFEWHGDRSGFRKDVRRYTLLVADGWTVLRFTWEDVLFRPDRVRRVVARAARLADTRTQLVSAAFAAA